MTKSELIDTLAAGIVLGLCLAWVFTILPLRVKLRNARHPKQSLDV